MKLRPTCECQQMNAVYSILKQTTTDELKQLFNESVLQATVLEANGDDVKARHCRLLAYQIRVHVQNELAKKERQSDARQ